MGNELVSSGLGRHISSGYRAGRIIHIKDVQAVNFSRITVRPAAKFIDNAYVSVLQDKK